jgi:hypothetical protein
MFLEGTESAYMGKLFSTARSKFLTTPALSALSSPFILNKSFFLTGEPPHIKSQKEATSSWAQDQYHI